MCTIIYLVKLLLHKLPPIGLKINFSLTMLKIYQLQSLSQNDSMAKHQFFFFLIPTFFSTPPKIPDVKSRTFFFYICLLQKYICHINVYLGANCSMRVCVADLLLNNRAETSLGLTDVRWG